MYLKDSLYLHVLHFLSAKFRGRLPVSEQSLQCLGPHDSIVGRSTEFRFAKSVLLQNPKNVSG